MTERDNRFDLGGLRPVRFRSDTEEFRMLREAGLIEKPTAKLVESTLRPLLGEYGVTDEIHGPGHLDRVLEYAMALRKVHGGNKMVITAAVLLHDLGRGDTTLHGEESRKLSIELARQVLGDSELNLYPEEIDRICEAIEDHDQPDRKPRTKEGRILKDADFLSGFGAEGILRTIYWTAQSGESIPEAIHRLKAKMPARMNGLEFPESREIAEREYKFVETFLSELDKPLPRIGGENSA